ncbi:hypothetical protein LT85_2538 [Collimonas arenae]|uniref:DUF2523 domain-containing protein n=1 Tax=Collimonas arenae TaxID=279058 RepID=A0A0A1FB03_9BURK|nr:DUF2523 domain-containing protein [Collimonas arenae]AIY41696.1 hypothetical protein LT85_2538 [Collimonas arenae]
MPIVLWLGPLIAGVLVSVAENLVYRVLAALAIGAVTFTGVSALVTQVRAFIFQNLANVGPVMDLMGLFGFGIVINIGLSAVVMRLTLSGLSASGSLTKTLTKGKS